MPRLWLQVQKPLAAAAAPDPGTDRPAARGTQAEGRAMTGRAPTDGRMDACLAVLDAGGSTSTEVAARLYGQPTYAATARAHGALLRLQKAGLVRSERTPLRVVWFRADDS